MRQFVVTLSAASLALGAVTFATPAASATHSVTITCGGNGSIQRSPLSALNVSSGNTVDVVNQSGGGLTASPTGATGVASLPMGTTQVFTVTAAPGSIALTSTSGTCSGTATNITLQAAGPNGDSDSSSSNSGPAPVQETLSLAVEASGATCTGGSPTGYSGSWLALPSADKCSQSGPTAKAGAKLLGWATTPNFPISIAQSQLDKGWGVYDGPINGERMIFIPAGDNGAAGRARADALGKQAVLARDVV